MTPRYRFTLLPSQMYRQCLVLHVARFVRLGENFRSSRPPAAPVLWRPYLAPECRPSA